jgi:hypothetical protein
MRVGGVGLWSLGVGLSDLLGARSGFGSEDRRSALLEPTFGRAKSCIVLFLMGGPPQHSTWDPKPEAPAEVRGPFAPIATSVPGIHFCELMPRLAALADKLAVLRAVSTGDNAHSSSGYYMLTGRPHAPKNVENANPGAPNDFPSLPAIAGRFLPERCGMPASVRLPHRISNTDGSVWPGQDAGFLGRSADPWLLNAGPAPRGLNVQEITLPEHVDAGRVARRKDLLDGLARGQEWLERDTTARVLNDRERQAYALLSSAQARAAFDVEKDDPRLVDRYGHSPFGQSVLMARRLVEAGVRLVQVNWYRGTDEPPANPCWDSHVDEPNRLKNVLVPPWDQAFSALIEDLSARGLLDETLVVSMAEFGRSPRLDPNAGRGHWGHVFSVALAGGGIKGGVAHGASDKVGGFPREGRVRPEDLSATLFHLMGIPAGSEFTDSLGRPIPASRGEVIRAIL